MTALTSTVYLVWKGKYSDAYVDAAFSAEADAQSYAAKENADTTYRDARVESMTLDDPEQVAAVRGLTPRWRFETWGWHRNRYRTVWPTLAPEREPTLQKAKNMSMVQNQGYPAEYWEGVIVADTEERALKIANDFYARKQAEAAGIT